MCQRTVFHSLKERQSCYKASMKLYLVLSLAQLGTNQVAMLEDFRALKSWNTNVLVQFEYFRASQPHKSRNITSVTLNTNINLGLKTI